MPHSCTGWSQADTPKHAPMNLFPGHSHLKNREHDVEHCGGWLVDAGATAPAIRSTVSEMTKMPMIHARMRNVASPALLSSGSPDILHPLNVALRNIKTM